VLPSMSIEPAKISQRTHPLLDAGVNTSIVHEGGGELMCVTTRFQLKRPWQLLAMYVSYRGLKQDLRAAPGLIRYAFLLESPMACCTLSVWASEQALIAFSNVPSHIQAVRRAKRLCRHIWSVYWRLHATSPYATRWPGAVPWPSSPGPFRPTSTAEWMVKKEGAR